MQRERCPLCRAILPEPKTCAGCGETFYRSEKGRRDSLYCTARCGTAARMRRLRRRRQET